MHTYKTHLHTHKTKFLHTHITKELQSTTDLKTRKSRVRKDPSNLKTAQSYKKCEICNQEVNAKSLSRHVKTHSIVSTPMAEKNERTVSVKRKQQDAQVTKKRARKA